MHSNLLKVVNQIAELDNKMKIKKEQLDAIKKQQEELSKVLHDIGVIEATKHSYLHQVAEINKEVENINIFYEIQKACSGKSPAALFML